MSIDTRNSASVFADCMFEPGYTCTINYGTDPSYTNLVYSDTSSTLDQVATITLSQDLQRDTVYYFIVSAESNSQCVRVRGRFRTGMVCQAVSKLLWVHMHSTQPSFQYLSSSQNVIISSVLLNAKLYSIMLCFSSKYVFFNSSGCKTSCGFMHL